MKKSTYYISILACFLFSFITPNLEQDFEPKTLNDIFPIDNIESVMIENINGKHQLTKKELESLKKNLKLAKYAGGLIEKPGHIYLKFKLKQTKNVVLGYAYASRNYIHFENEIDKNNKQFTGSYKMPEKFNFDSYK
ncbi:hypothetical protein [Flavobacterium terrae]|uniref:Uncharacterized protein n=1 Tax=Flavobacterium terrae TaxID=415425 RepID=A0A1M6D2B3_9FLAO|nr:hypothetical protein [Flavobacterium terrae]SHI67376.1 hypothetical protein SAMN05444363_1216 [Flavobacterium terrae]